MYFCNGMRKNAIILHMNRLLACLSVATLMLFLGHLPAHGQPGGGTIDSLYHVFQFSNADKAVKVNAVNEVARMMHDQEITDTLYRCNKNDDTRAIEATMHYLMAEYYYDTGQYENALQEAQQAHDLMRRGHPDKFQSDVLGVLSNTQYRMEEYDEALRTLLEAYALDQKLNNKELISSDLNSLAAIYLAVEQPAQGLQFIEQSIAIERSLGRPDRIATRLGMASELYLINDEPAKAMSAINEAISIYQQARKPEKVAVKQVQKGAVLEKMDRLEDARRIIEQALPALTHDGATYSLAVAYNQLGSIMLKLGHRQQAIDYYKQALDLSIKCGTPKIERTAERGLWEAMRDSNPQGALLHLERYTELNDSMLVEMAATRINVMNVTNQDTEQHALDQKNEALGRLVKWLGLGLVILLAAGLTAMLYSRRRLKRALTIQRQNQVLRDHFFDNITNEFQTPLSVVMNAGQQLLSADKASAAENKRLGQMIVSHGHNMLNLVNQMLDLEKVKANIEQPDTKRSDIVMFVRMLVERFQEQAQLKLIDLAFITPVNSLTVTFAPEYIERILRSLLESAIEYTSRNGKITVKLNATEPGWMRLVVADTGKGIPEEERSHLFEPMNQSRNGDDGVNTALRLTMVHQVVLAMNGRIDVDSQLGKGTTFTIDFPVPRADGDGTDSESQLVAEEHVRQPGGEGYKPLVFIVENNDDIAFFIASKLGKSHNLRFARDGREALQNAQDMVPDLIITDMIMPIMGGKQFIDQVRAHPGLSHIPIIAITAISSDKERIECYEAGADAVLVKPFNTDELLLLSQRLISQRAALRERYMRIGTSTANDSPDKEMSRDDKEFISKLVDIIPSHMVKGNIDMDSIAAALSMSRKQLRERITAIMGMTPVAFVLQVRLNYASNLIVNSDTPMTAIAQQCGFSNQAHFSKMFKQQFGVSPQQFRKDHNNMNLINHPRVSSP